MLPEIKRNDKENKPNINVLLNYQVFDKIVFLDNYGNDFFIKDVYDL